MKQHDLLWAANISSQQSTAALLLPHDFAKQNFGISDQFNFFIPSIYPFTFHSRNNFTCTVMNECQEVWYRFSQNLLLNIQQSERLRLLYSGLWCTMTLRTTFFWAISIGCPQTMVRITTNHHIISQNTVPESCTMIAWNHAQHRCQISEKFASPIFKATHG